MIIVGLTGGVGSGKSTAAECFEAFSVPIVDADQIARTLVAPGKPVLARIVARYGRGFLQADGSLDRTKLRERIFKEPDERYWLETLLHPLIYKALKADCEYFAQWNPAYIVLVIPLLVEKKLYEWVDRVLVIDCPEYMQNQRLKQRYPNLEDTLIKAMIASQVTRQGRLAVADDIIVNKGSIEYLSQQVASLHAKYESEG